MYAAFSPNSPSGSNVSVRSSSDEQGDTVIRRQTAAWHGPVQLSELVLAE